MKVIVEKYLYARKRADTCQPAPYYRSPGDIIDVDYIVAGQELEGNSIWYHATEDDCYYWSGGISSTGELWPDQHVDELTLDAVYKSALNELAPRYRHIYGYQGVAAGYKEEVAAFTKKIAIVFYVSKKNIAADTDPELKVPETIHYRGFQLLTDVREQKSIKLFESISADNRHPYLMGGSISESIGGTLKTYGTRTVVVKYNDDDYLLTCYHVACSSFFEQGIHTASGGSVQFPSNNVTPGLPVINGEVFMANFNAAVDYALIKVPSIHKALSNWIFGHQFKGCYKIDEIIEPILSKTTFIAYGATSGNGQRHTFPAGTLIACHGEEVIVDAGKGLRMKGLVELTCIALDGDSGAPVIDQKGKLLGYVIAGTDRSTFILPFAMLKKNISLDINP